ncbi:hypothetical protein BDY21DRAFT_361601 [Lineolata rhizophorae]|uniref:Caspase domain-containing protein n=1 Tax=Lineolata rhizophorae TaxID=578093 RepID=A0A6A6P9N1_9PEZI|nr:hypothetical protein BDY21DRAFT_361601 [Lineolata rhizophorae]
MATSTATRESPQTKRRRLTEFDRHHESSRVLFNKTISGCYHNGHAEYDEVGVLLITWEDDDLYSSKFRYKTSTYEIPSDRSMTGLNRAIADFAYLFDSPHKLMMLYYGGHAQWVEEKLVLFANQTSGEPSAFFEDAIHSLNLSETDIFLVVDCCFAARAFSRRECGKKKCELLSSTGPEGRALAPRFKGSFTRVLIESLESLLEAHPKGFATSMLYRDVYFRQMGKRKPFLFDQSRVDYGKIWLRPMNRPQNDNAVPRTDGGDVSDGSNARSQPKAAIDLRLQLNNVPNHQEINHLAKSLQYLPHVREIQFQGLSAPGAQLQEFMRGLRQAQLLRPLVARLRRKLAERRLREQSQANGSTPHGTDLSSSSRLQMEPRQTPLYDWSEAVMQWSDDAHASANVGSNILQISANETTISQRYLLGFILQLDKLRLAQVRTLDEFAFHR